MSSDRGKIKLLFLHPTFTFGGAERTAFNLLNGLNKDKFSIILVTSKNIASHFSGMPLEKIIYIEDMGIDVWFREVNAANLKKFHHDIKAIAGLLKRESPDIAFGMMYYASSLLSIAKKFFRLKPKVISSPRGPLTPYLDTFLPGKDLNRLFWKMNFHFSCRYSDGVVVAAHGTKDDCVQNYGARSETVYVVNNGIETERVRELASETVDLPIPRDYHVISTAGRLCYEKNIPLLLKAFALVRRAKKVKLLVIGDGTERQALENLCAGLGIRDDVYFLGFQENPYKFMKRSDIFVHTCLLEGFGNVVVEAMACGVTVIANDCPYGPREIIINGENGILTPMGDADALAKGMLLLLEDERRRQDLSERGRRRALEFSVDRMVKAYEEIFIHQY